MYRIFHIIACAVVLIGTTISPEPVAAQERSAASNRLVFILAGQSNMSGRGAVAELPGGFPRNGNRLWTFTNADQWAAAAEPVDSSTGQVDPISADDSAGVGPALAFADTLAEALPNLEIGLVPCAKGGSSIAEWESAANPSTLFGSCLRRAKIACQWGRIGAILWHQGESDAASLEQARVWNQRLEELVKSFRQKLGAQALPVIGATIGGQGPKSDDRFRFWDELLHIQQNVRLPGVTLIDGTKFEIGRDGLHYSTAGQLKLGQALAKAYLALPDRTAYACSP